MENLNSPEYLANQYRDAANLKTRIHLHDYSTNPYGWFHWVFDQFSLPDQSKILELGCGTGELWRQNLHRIPAGWDILLTDFSAGMLQQAQDTLTGPSHFQFQLVDAQSTPLPFDSTSFDAVIANHMVFHINDKPALFSEIHRILKPGRTCFTSTVGQNTMWEMKELITRFDRALAVWGQIADSFNFENGATQLLNWFKNVELRRYEDALEVPDSRPLIDYILSGSIHMEGERLDRFREFVAKEIERQGGLFHISKDTGMFVSVK